MDFTQELIERTLRLKDEVDKAPDHPDLVKAG